MIVTYALKSEGLWFSLPCCIKAVGVSGSSVMASRDLTQEWWPFFQGVQCGRRREDKTKCTWSMMDGRLLEPGNTMIFSKGSYTVS